MFGNKTLLQHKISTLLDKTSYSDFLYQCEGVNCDGYSVSEENKAAIDECLSEYPEMLFLPCLDAINQSSSVMHFASRRFYPFGGFYGIDCHGHKALTSVMAYLIESGAGIGCIEPLFTIDLQNLQPQLFVGSSAGFRKNTRGTIHHIFDCSDVINFYREKKLSETCMMRLHHQAIKGLKYGNFSDETNQELKRVIKVLSLIKRGLIHDLNNQQILAYADYENELKVLFFQALPQKILPDELILKIASDLTGLDSEDAINMHTAMMKR